MAQVWGWRSPVLGIEWDMATRFLELNLKATLFSLLAILAFHIIWKLRSRFLQISSSSTVDSPFPYSPPESADSPSINQNIVSDEDLKFLIENLDGKLDETERWEDVIDKRNNLLSYNAKCCKPKDGGPLKYLSTTIFQNCDPETLRDFYLDNDYRKQWDKTIVEHEQLQVYETNGIEIGRTLKKFPLLTAREYVLAWRLWEGTDKTFYCFIKECEHPLAPIQRKFVRVACFRSGWRIKKVPGTDACEIKMFHQEDAGLNMDMARLAFARGIWSYVCKMDIALRKYSPVSHPRVASALTLIQKVPPEVDVINETRYLTTTSAERQEFTGSVKERRYCRRPSKKLVAKGLLVVGGAICLSRGHSVFGAKVAMAYILTKLSKRGGASRPPSGENLGTS